MSGSIEKAVTCGAQITKISKQHSLHGDPTISCHPHFDFYLGRWEGITLVISLQKTWWWERCSCWSWSYSYSEAVKEKGHELHHTLWHQRRNAKYCIMLPTLPAGSIRALTAVKETEACPFPTQELFPIWASAPLPPSNLIIHCSFDTTRFLWLFSLCV